MFQRTTTLNKIKDLAKRIKIVQGGTSAGKTFAILPLLIDRAIKTPNLEISVVSESIPHLKRGALKDFLKIMKSTGRFIKEHYHITDRKYTFSNGSYIEFFSPESILGARRNILFVNECNHITFNDYHQLAIRTDQEIYLDYNPANEFWVHTEIKDDKDADFIIVTYEDNEALSPTIVNELEKAKEKAKTSDYWANWWRVYGLGQTGTLEGVIFGDFKSVDKFPDHSACKWIGYGLDFGYSNDVTALTKIGLKGGEIYLQQLIYETGLTNIYNSTMSETDRKNTIQYRLEELGIGKGELIVADSSEPKTIKELNGIGYKIKPAKKGKDSIINGIDLMQRYKYNITEDSLGLIKEWRGYSWTKEKDTNNFTNKPVDDLNHAIDGIRYLMQYKIKHGFKKQF